MKASSNYSFVLVFFLVLVANEDERMMNVGEGPGAYFGQTTSEERWADIVLL